MLDGKTKAHDLYSRLESSNFHEKCRKLSKPILNEEQNCALESSSKDRNIVTTKLIKRKKMVY